MALNPDFVFSQNSLQDYIDCPRRFELRWVLQQKWPAVQSEPALEQERQTLRGQRFHQLIHQHLIGIPVEQLTPQVSDPDLLRWWQNYLQADPLRDLPALHYTGSSRHYPEYRLTAAFEGFRLVAQYDLLAIQPGERVVIVDWKTSHQHLTAAYLKLRIQSRLYPLLLAEAGAGLNCGHPIKPEQIEMIYWFAAHPSQPVHLPYGADQYQIDREALASLIHEIHALPAGRFTLTANEAHCKYCTYRSLCGRGVSAGAWDDSDPERDRSEDTLINLDFDQIGEIAF